MTNINDSGNDPQVWFTSDTHFGHKNIITYCDRPWNTTDEMDEAIIANWNAVVAPQDKVFHLGDVALGSIEKSLPKVGRLNGYKISVTGNHDRLFHTYSNNHRAKFYPEYMRVFQQVWGESGAVIVIGGKSFTISHFPYTGDHTPEDRHVDARPVDGGMPLIHGHTHTTDKLTYSTKGTPQIHVGQDAWEYRPVHSSEIISLLEGA